MADFDFGQFTKGFMNGVSNVADNVATVAKETTGDVFRHKQFGDIGRDLVAAGLTTSHGGNLSVSDGDSIWISGTGSMLGHMSSNDVCKVFMSPTDLDEKASMELVVHRAMYNAWSALCREQDVPFGTKAIIHAHTKYTTYRSLVDDVIDPKDSEGKLVLGNSVPVLVVDEAVASEEVATQMAAIITGGGFIGVVRGHGPFVLADTLEDALRLISCLEYSSELLTIFDMTGKMPL